MMIILNYIAGEHRASLSQKTFEVIDPARAQAYAQAPESDEQDLAQAVDAAFRAFPAWSQTLPQHRTHCLNKLADLIEEDFEAFARAECIDTGKPLTLCRRVDIPRSIANLRAFAQMALTFEGQSFSKPDSFSFTHRQAIGVVAAISPWNLPLLLLTWKIAPALAAGNCVIAKPSEVTPMTAFMLSLLIEKAGFPAGVLQILHGHGAQIGALISKHPGIKAISFTGGTSTGKDILSLAAPQLKRVTLELGGKNPFIVFDDAKLSNTVETAVSAAFSNQGQICLCASRIFVQESLYPQFKKAFLEQLQKLVLGDPLEENTQFSALVSQTHRDKVLSYIELAKKEGVQILCGGKTFKPSVRCQNGYFIEPTVLEGVGVDSRLFQEEIFGPVVLLMPFKDEKEAVRLANHSAYGLAASVWTQDRERAIRVSKTLDTGIVWINCWNLRDLDTPFGGMKDSGLGREGKQRAMEFFTEEKTITMPAGLFF